MSLPDDLKKLESQLKGIPECAHKAHSSIQSMNGNERTIQMMISPFDEKYPEFSWCEVVKCFHELNGILVEIIDEYADHKNG